MSTETPKVEKDIPQDENVVEEVVDPKQVRSRAMRPTNSVHFGDVDFEVEDNVGDATWGEVCTMCCVHDANEWGWIFVGVCTVLFFLYFFLFGLELLGAGAKVMTGCAAGALFGDDTNPIAALMVGILATVLLQSSSTTTSIIVSLVGPAISVNTGIYMVMGANIGTTVTNTIVAMGQMGDGDQLERAFAGATVHDMFNFLTVFILLPVEVVTHYLAALTYACVRNATLNEGESWEGPIKKIVAPLVDHIIIANKKVVEKVALNEATCAIGGGFYPVNCTDPSNPTYDSCKVGLISCDKTSNECPAFFQPMATVVDDKVSGGVVFFLGIAILFICLFALVTVLQKMLLGLSARIIYKATDLNGYVAMVVGAVITLIVQSSSITTSTLTPLVGMGVLRIEQMYPLTLGANIGTTVTALLASMVGDSIGSLQVALAHLFFNVTGILIWYPIPFMRRIPIHLAKLLGKATRIWRGFPLLYIFVAFIAFPLVFLGISLLFTQDKVGLTVLGSIVVVAIFIGLVWTAYWCKYQNGQQSCIDCFAKREKKRLVMVSLPEDMEFLKARVAALTDHTGLPVDEEEGEGEEAEDTMKEDDKDEKRSSEEELST